MNISIALAFAVGLLAGLLVSRLTVQRRLECRNARLERSTRALLRDALRLSRELKTGETAVDIALRLRGPA